VVAITVKLWADPETDGAKACCSPEAVLGGPRTRPLARDPALTLDLEEEFASASSAACLRPTPKARPPTLRLVQRRVRLKAMIDLAERLGADRLLTGHYARIVEMSTGRCWPPPPTRPRTRATCWRRCRRSMLGRLGFPLTELTKPEVREIAERHGPAGRPQGRVTGPLLPRRPGQAQLPASHGGLATATAPCSTAPGARRSPPRPTTTSPSASRAGSASRLPAALRDRHRRRRQYVKVGTRADVETRHIDIRDVVLHRDGARSTQGPACATTRAALRPRSASPASSAQGPRGRAREQFVGASPGQTAVLAGGRDDRRRRHDHRS